MPQRDLSIANLQRQYKSGECTPDQVLSHVLKSIASCERKGVWICVLTPAQIHAQLKRIEADRQSGKALPLYGIPFAVKDNIDVAGIPTTAACPAFSYIPARSATVVQRLCDAGAIVVGKTNMDQFATGLVGTRSPYGACENAFDPEWISGGSSSGSAVAVACGLASFSLGTDTAGSGRVPASFNDLVGLKPTKGLLSTSGVVPACRSLDCVSIFAHTCADADAVLKVAAGFDIADPFSRQAPSNAASSSDTFRCGIPADEQLEFFGNREAENLYRSAIEHVRALGGKVVPIDFKPFRDTANLLYEGPWVVERLFAAGALLKDNPDALRDEICAILKGAERYTAADVFDGLYKLAALQKAAAEQWAQMDLLLLPTTGTIYRNAEVEADPFQLNRNLGYYTNFVNLLDLSAIAVPNGKLSTGVPMGVTFMAPAFQERQLLSIGAAFQARAKEGKSL